MKRYLFAAASIAALVLVSYARADAQEFHATFSGFNEIGGVGVGETGAILSEGEGTLTLNLDNAAKTLTYTLNYSGLSSNVILAHIHFGKVHVAGGVMVFLCTNLPVPPPAPPAATPPPCPVGGGTVSGTIHATDVVAVASQNVTAGDFDALQDALTSNTAYRKYPYDEVPGGRNPRRDPAGRGCAIPILNDWRVEGGVFRAARRLPASAYRKSVARL
jgi:CHRD domain